jgi:uncharacterized protein (TIGR02646 family)
MRRIVREPLHSNTMKTMQDYQQQANRQANLDPAAFWKRHHRKKPIQHSVIPTLKRMAGSRERCMYCEDSHGMEIDHFRPKATFPQLLFCWENLLLACAECNRVKGDRFPMANGQPLLVDPTVDDPWQFLDFDPDTGNLTARYDRAHNSWSPKGQKTVDVLQLDRREALSTGYRRTFRRLKDAVQRVLQGPLPTERVLIDTLRQADDHGLLGWCFTGTGQHVPPFCTLRTQHPALWQTCANVLT